MHNNSLELMKNFITICLDSLDINTKLRILDVGSYDVNGSYREIFKRPNWEYIGADIMTGPNVDKVFKSPYDWGDEQYDVVISGQCLEHVEDIKEWALQLKRVVKNGGFICLIAPCDCEEHRYPIDCWRILPDGMRFILEKICGFQVLATYRKNDDCIGFAKKWIN